MRATTREYRFIDFRFAGTGVHNDDKAPARLQITKANIYGRTNHKAGIRIQRVALLSFPVSNRVQNCIAIDSTPEGSA